MTVAPLRSSWQIASRLLALEAWKDSGVTGRIRTLPALLGFTNLFFCGFLDHHLRSDVDGSFLGLFLFAQASLLTIIAITSFIRSGGEIIEKTWILPTTHLSRWLFVSCGNLRRPTTLALWLTSSLFLAVFHAHRWTIAFAAVILFGLIVLNVELVIALVTLWLKRTSRPVEGLAVLSVLSAILIPIVSLVFDERAVLQSVPFVASAAAGIAAMSAGHAADAAASALILSGLAVLWYVLGRFVA